MSIRYAREVNPICGDWFASSATRCCFVDTGLEFRCNHFPLLLAPGPGLSVSRILQSLTVAHTWHYHKARDGVGHVWQGRFKSPVIQDDDNSLVVLRYIEANPLRAGMVADLASYPWSSYRAHGMGQPDPLLSPLPAWHALGRDETARQAFWRGWVRTPLTDRDLQAVRRSVVSGRPYGEPSWAEAIARSLHLPPPPQPRGRPRQMQIN